MTTPAAAHDMARGDLNMAVCRECGFVFNAAFDLGRLSYGEAYDNNQACSATFREYLTGLVRHLTEEESVRNCRIVDVGCGGGDFLRRLVAAGAGNTGAGFDPAYAGPDTDCDGRVRFERRYYGQECADVPADVVVCRHVIEHVPEPVELLRTVRQALAGSPHARVYFETPDVAWILRNRVLWDFFYEHCSLFTAQSLTTAFESAGFSVSKVDHIFGGQYLWLEADLGDDAPPVTRDPANLPALAHAFCACEKESIRNWDATLTALRQRGKIALWGAGAKGVTFANLVDPRRERIDCVVDLNPNKQGRYLPGTGHPIVEFHELPPRDVKSAILMNPNYLAENQTLLRDAGLAIDLIGYEQP